MDVGAGVGVRGKQLYIPSMQISGRGFGVGLSFASTQTVRTTRIWSSPLQQHHLIAGRSEIPKKCHILMVSKANTVLNNPPSMVGEVKIASNDYVLMAADAETSSEFSPYTARESKIESNHRPVMAKEGIIASNCCPPMAGEVKLDSNTCPLMAKEGRIVSYRKKLLSHAVKIVSNGKEIGIRNTSKQVNYQQVKYMHDNHRPARVSEEKCISVSEGRCFEAKVSGPGHTHSNALRKGVVEQNYSQQANSMSNKWVVGRNSYQQSNSTSRIWVVGRNSSQQSYSTSSRLHNGRPSFNTAQTREWNMSQSAVIEGFPSKAIDLQKSENNMNLVGTWKQATQDLKDLKINDYVPETQCKPNSKFDVPCSLKKQPEFEDISVKKQEREHQGTTKSVDFGSSSGLPESAVKSKHNNRKKGIGKSTDNDSQVSASDLVATEISELKECDVKDRLCGLYEKICIVDEIDIARSVVSKLMGEYRNLVHACDTEVADIDVKKQSPVGHGKMICFSIYCGSNTDFGDGKSCVWVDVLDGDKDILSVFAPYFEDSSIRKIFHNYSFDRHIIANHGINVSGFYADTMHLARLWNSARREEGGYSLESLTKDPKVMDGIGVAGQDLMIEGKLSTKTIFGKKKLKKDGLEGKTIIVAPVEELQITERKPWVCYSALDSISTWKLWKSLQTKLKDSEWTFQGDSKHTMYDFYEKYWRPFGELLVQMESKGMLVDREHLSKMEEVAKQEQKMSASRFKSWASSYCPDAKYMNVSSDTQVRQLLFGGMPNNKDPDAKLPMKRTMKVPNDDNFIDEGKKAPLKSRNIELHGLGAKMEVEQYTVSGWPAVSSAALKLLAGKVSIDYGNLADEGENEFTGDMDDDLAVLTSSGVKSGKQTIVNKKEDTSVYGTAYSAFGGGEAGKKACHAIAALCEVNSINTLISNFLLPLQGKEISGKDGRVHCSLNINTETGRLSARNPNLQNQPALEKDRYKIRQAFIASEGNTLIVADYGQLELRILAHLSNCRSMLDAFKAGGDFHSRTAMNMYAHVRDAVEKKNVLLEWDLQPSEEIPPIPLLKDVFASERRKAKMLNFSIAYGKTAVGLSKDWKVSLNEAKETVNLWYNERKEVLQWQEERKHEARTKQCVYTLLGRARHLPCTKSASFGQTSHIERAAINTPVQGSAADVAMCAMLEISRNARLKELGWTLVLQVHDEVILEGPTETAEEAKALVVNCMSYPFCGENILQVDLAVDAKYAPNWYGAK